MTAFTKETEALLPSAQWPALHARLRHTLAQCGLMVVSGEPGVGKTAAVRSFVHTLDPTTCTVLYLADPTLTPRALYRCLADQLGLQVAWSGCEAARAVRQALLARREAGAVPLLILDEADALPLSILGELRVLQNAEMDHGSPTAVVLIGAPLLRQHLRLQQLAALAQRVTAAYQLVGLTAAETAAYVDLQRRSTAKSAAMAAGSRPGRGGDDLARTQERRGEVEACRPERRNRGQHMRRTAGRRCAGLGRGARERCRAVVRRRSG